MALGGNGFTRRQVIRSLAGGSILLPGMLAELSAEEASSSDPLSPRAPHHPARAKRVIFIFLAGGFSQLDTFDPKPRLTADHGKEIAVGGDTARR